MHKIFGREGYLESVHSNYEFRHEQLQMSEFILERLVDRENGLIEAGTGIGKTLAYLIPAIIYSLKNNKTLAVSTETKALQKQLIDKDIPLVKEVIRRYSGEDFQYSLCLGSYNYPCIKRFESLLSLGKFSKSEIKIVDEIKERFSDKEVFTRLDIKISNKMWSEIAREPEICNHYYCPFFTMCVFQRAKKEWANSKMLVMNHYLFFTNIASGKTYLPKFNILVFDEAHSIEEIASEQLGFDISYNQVMDVIQKLYKPRRKASILMRISDDSKREGAINTIEVINKELGAFFENLRKKFKQDQNTVRQRDSLPLGEGLIGSLKSLLFALESIEDDFDEEFWKIEFDLVRGKIYLFLRNIESFCYLQDDNFVYWIERGEGELFGDIHIKGEPIDVSEAMDKNVNSFYESNIYVSATLTIRRDFSYFAGRLGISDYKSLLLDSPFDYKRQVVLFLEKRTALPDDPSYTEQVTKISGEIIDFVGGNCLILFTSYRMLGSVRERLLNFADFPIYAQGDFPAAETVNRYIKDKGSVLMGTHSFWQGIDLPGDLLRCVILIRLPFSVPDRPLVQARIELLQKQGLDPFFNYQIPNAIIRFKQGFGRLIRSSKDRGVVAVLDSRILTKNYGKLFLNSLPECNTVQTIDDLKSAYSC